MDFGTQNRRFAVVCLITISKIPNAHKKVVLYADVYCGKPPEVKDAKTQYNGTAFGSIAKYSCKEGLFLDGNPDIFCMENGKWQTPPSCSRKNNNQL